MVDMFIYGFILVAFFFTTPFILWDVYKNNLIGNIKKSDSIGMSVVAFIPLLNHIGYLLYLIENEGKTDGFKYSKRNLNKVYTCYSCGITSRQYQLKNNGNTCPHCDSSVRLRFSVIDKDDEEYPFAPKLSTMQFIKIQRHNNKVTKIKEKLHNTERYDRELESYEQLQLKKLQELESKAQEIRAELAKKEN